MPKVKMMKTTRGSPDGIRVETFVEGETYSLPDALARAFISEMRVAKYADDLGQPLPPKKAAPAAPENKDAGRAPENKEDSSAHVSPYWDGQNGPTDHNQKGGRRRLT